MERRLPKLSVNALYRLKWLVGALMAFVSMTALLNLESLSRVPAVIGIIAIGACVFFQSSIQVLPLSFGRFSGSASSLWCQLTFWQEKLYPLCLT